MAVLKSSNQEQFPLDVLEPVACQCLSPQDCTCVEDEASVPFS